MKRIIIAGGRDFIDERLALDELDKITPGLVAEEIQIISGGANGADKIGINIAQNHNTNLAIFPAQWATHGKSAGYKRNYLMAQNADVLLAFWDGESKGTGHMIDIARTANLEVHVVIYAAR